MSQPALVVQIVEVIGPAEQGKSIPFLCGGSDGHRYYVKGQQTNRSSLDIEGQIPIELSVSHEVRFGLLPHHSKTWRF